MQGMPQEEETESLRRITQEELNDLVKLHKRFMEGRNGGRRAILRKVDLSGLSLREEDLRQADFTGCVMQGMDLAGANFREASLYAPYNAFYSTQRGVPISSYVCSSC